MSTPVTIYFHVCMQPAPSLELHPSSSSSACSSHVQQAVYGQEFPSFKTIVGKFTEGQPLKKGFL